MHQVPRTRHIDVGLIWVEPRARGALPRGLIHLEAFLNLQQAPEEGLKTTILPYRTSWDPLHRNCVECLPPMLGTIFFRPAELMLHLKTGVAMISRWTSGFHLHSKNRVNRVEPKIEVIS